MRRRIVLTNVALTASAMLLFTVVLVWASAVLITVRQHDFARSEVGCCGRIAAREAHVRFGRNRCQLLGGIPEEMLRTFVPGQDDPLGVMAENGIVRRGDNRAKLRHREFSSFHDVHIDQEDDDTVDPVVESTIRAQP